MVALYEEEERKKQRERKEGVRMKGGRERSRKEGCDKGSGPRKKEYVERTRLR